MANANSGQPASVPQNEDSTMMNSSTIEDQLAEMRAMMAELRSTLEQQASGTRIGAERAQAIPNPTASNTRRKPLPSPPKFDGQRKNYAGWAHQIREKCTIDESFFTTRREMFYYINSCLDTVPQQAVSNFYVNGAKIDWDPTRFMSHLDSIYRDVDLQPRAAAALRAMRQGESQSFASFMLKFEQKLVEAGGDSWTDPSKVVYLEGALNSLLTKTVAPLDLPRHDFVLFHVKLAEIAARVERAQRVGKSTNAPRGGTHRGQYQRDADGDIVMSKLQTDRRREGSGRVETRTCYACDKKGHLARDCPQRKSQRVAQVQEVDDSDEGSGKE